MREDRIGRTSIASAVKPGGRLWRDGPEGGGGVACGVGEVVIMTMKFANENS